MSAALAQGSNPLRTAEISAGRTPQLVVVPLPPEDVTTYIDRHCPECGMLEPHHDTHCVWKEDRQ